MKLLLIPMIFVLVGCDTVPRKFYEEKLIELNNKINEQEIQINELDRLREENMNLKRQLKIQGKQKDLYETLSEELRKILDTLVDEGVQRLPGDGWRFGVDLLFKPGSDDISPKGKEILAKFTQAWKGQTVMFKIEGHTDKDPIVKTAKDYPTKTNLELGMRRSLAVMQELVASGISEKAIILVSKGNNSPLAPNDDNPDNKRKNRRVEIYILQ